MSTKLFSEILISCLPTHRLRQGARKRLLSTRRATVNDMSFEVEPSEFWYKFNKGTWEPEAFDFYKKYVSPVKDVIDMGGWIGPTMLFAYAFNARKISVVEADPANFQVLKNNVRKNFLEDRVLLYNLCLSERSGDIVSFGAASKKKGSSTKHIGGGQTKVKTTSMMEFIRSQDLNEVSIIKIDIEGAEQDVVDSLDFIAGFKDIAVLFSIHVPLWRDAKKTTMAILESLQKFDVCTDTDQPMSREDTRKRLEKGGYFCLILKTKVTESNALPV